MPDATVIVDRDGCILYINRVTEELFGYSRSELLGQQVEVLAPARFRDMHRVHRAGFIAVPRRRPMGLGLELEGLKKDGGTFPAEISLAPLQVGSNTYTVAAVRDVTERKKIDQRAQRWQKAREEIRQRDAFLAAASHELYGPLGILQQELAVLQRAADQPPDGLRAIRSMETIQRETRHLARMVNELLEFSHIRLGQLRLTLEEADLAQLALEAAGSLREEVEATGSGLIVRAKEPVIGRWDPHRIQGVVTTLLLNALRFGEGKPIALQVEASPERARLTVEDHGVGIPPEDHARVFNPFERTLAAGIVAGLGLGLYIARYVVQAHGGIVQLRSEPGAGSTFTVELPRTPQPPAALPTGDRVVSSE